MITCHPETACHSKPAPLPGGLPFAPVVVRETTAEHCFSVCLYREPEFARRFPNRDFATRYLSAMPRIKSFLASHNFHLNIFADLDMLETAVSFDCGSVYVVPGPSAFPFSQHIYRYYSALLPEHPTIKAFHFRGLDNVLVEADELALLRHFVSIGGEILHAPYMRAAGSIYTPVRGTCSTARNGTRSLAAHLRQTPHVAEDDVKGTWHSDEAYLAKWFSKARQSHFLYTIIDREMPIEFHMAFAAQIRAGKPFHIARLHRSTFTRPSK
jgi:hypothetical protein